MGKRGQQLHGALHTHEFLGPLHPRHRGVVDDLELGTRLDQRLGHGRQNPVEHEQVDLALDLRTQRLGGLPPDGRGQQHPLLLGADQRLGCRHPGVLDEDLEQCHEERVVDRRAPLIHLLLVDVDPRAGIERLDQGITVAVHPAHVQPTGSHVHRHGPATQNPVVMQQDRWVDEFVDSADVGFRHLVEHLDVRQRGHRRSAAVDLIGRGHVARDGVRETVVAPGLGHEHLFVQRDVIRPPRLAPGVHAARIVVRVGLDTVEKREQHAGHVRILQSLLHLLGQSLHSPLLGGLARREPQFPVNRVDDALVVLTKVQVPQVHAPIPEPGTGLEVSEQRPGAKCTHGEPAFGVLAGEVGFRGVPGREQGLVDRVEPPFDLEVLVQVLVGGLEVVPDRLPRGQHRVHDRAEPLQCDLGLGVEDFLGLLLPIGAGSCETDLPGQDPLCDFLPVLLPGAAVALEGVELGTEVLCCGHDGALSRISVAELSEEEDTTRSTMTVSDVVAKPLQCYQQRGKSDTLDGDGSG